MLKNEGDLEIVKIPAHVKKLYLSRIITPFKPCNFCRQNLSVSLKITQIFKAVKVIAPFRIQNENILNDVSKLYAKLINFATHLDLPLDP